MLSEDPATRKRARFEATAIPFLRTLYGAALRLTRQPADANDLVQESYLRAYRTFDNFVPGTNCKAWLFTIMYSVFINRFRKARSEPVQVPFDETVDRVADLGPPQALEEALIRQAFGGRGEEVNRVLDRLPDAFRSAVILVDLEGLSYEEAAAALGCPVGTIRSRLYRARKQMYIDLHDLARRTGYLKPTAGKE